MAVRGCLAGVLAGAACAASAQALPAGAQRGGTFVEPPARVDPVYTPLGPDQPASSTDVPRLQLALGLHLPLRPAGARSGRGTQGTAIASPALQATLRWRPLDDPGWFVQATGWRYLHGDRQRPWDPDFTYAFGYDDGQPGWSLAYANYSGTRLAGDADRRRFNLPQGQWTLGWRFGLPPAMEQLLLVGDGDGASCRADANHVARYTREAGGELGRGKVSFALGCRYTRPGGWFAQAAAYAWPDGSQQQPWDPDYTYAFGWAGAGGWSVQYGNYSGNRWSPGRRAAGEGRLRSGSLSVAWTAGW